jgi:Tol biopolymer transport system component
MYTRRPFAFMPAAALVTTALAAGCSDAQLTGDGPAGPSHAVATTTEASIFSPGVISDHRWQYRITFTANGKTAYYTVADNFFPAVRQSSIYVSHLQHDGAWSTPVVADFSGTYTDIDPFITPNGQRMYFSSIRPLDGVPKPDLDIFVMERTPSGWSEPVRLGPEINTAQDELYPSADASGTLYFASGPFGPTPESDWNIYNAQRVGSGFAQRQPIDAINTRLPWNPADPTWDWEFNPEISVDGRTLIFTSLRPGGYGFGDLYVSHLHQGEWSEPVNLGPAVNTSDDEFHPTLSRDRRTLYFARTVFSPTFVPSDFYSVPTSALEGFRR